MKLRPAILSISAILFIVGSGYIIANERPVAKLVPQTKEESVTTEVSLSPSTTPSTKTSDNMFSIAEIAKHATQDDCWSAINGTVYDLTTFVSRHPGGPKRILRLCGMDGSEKFNDEHGKSGAAQTALALLKIGTLN